MPSRIPCLLAALLLVACGRTVLDDGPSHSDGGTPTSDASLSATTTLTPPPGAFNGSVEVTLSTDRPATIYFTTDGSDPKTSPEVRSQASPVVLTFEKTTTLAFFSRTPEGLQEDARSVMYVRAGGPAGTVTGVVVVGELAAGHEVAVSADLAALPLGYVEAPAEIPFTIADLASGTHRLQAIADTDGDGAFLPVLDLAGTQLTFELDLADPFKASLEGVRLYLAASQPGLCSFKGTVTFPVPVPNQNLSVAALDPNLIQGGADPQTLLAAFGSGYRVTTNATEVSYPYLITDLTPGQYLPVPALIGAGAGISLNLLVNLGGARDCPADGVATADFAYGQVSLAGTVRYTPASPALWAWGAVAARNISFSLSGIEAQIVLMPTFLLAGGADGTLGGTFGAVALKDDALFDLRAFTSLDASATGNPVIDALTWATNPFSTVPPQATFTATPPSQTVKLTAP